GTRAQRASRADLVSGTRSLSFSPDGNAVAYTDGYAAWLWQFKTNKAPAFLDKLTQWISVVYNVDGIPLALGKDSSGWRLWGKRVAPQHPVLPGYTNNMSFTSVVFSGHRIASGELLGETYLWDLATRQQTGTLPTSNRANVLLSPDERWLAASDGGVQLWDM